MKGAKTSRESGESQATPATPAATDAARAPLTPGTTKRVIRSEQLLRYEYTPEERGKLGQDLAQILAEQGEIAEEFETLKDQYKLKLREVSGKLNAMAVKVRSGFEMRSTAVDQCYDLDAGTYTVVRIDSGEIVETRSLVDTERQMVLEVGRVLPEVG